MNCTTHHICDCHAERIKKLESFIQTVIDRDWNNGMLIEQAKKALES